MVLMGLGQGAYLGKKLLMTASPRLSDGDTSVGAAGTSSTIAHSGSALGNGVGDHIPLNGVTLAVVPTGWSDTSVQLLWPSAQPSADPWVVGQQASVGFIVNGQVSSPLPVLI